MNNAEWEKTLIPDRYVFDSKIRKEKKFSVLWDTLVRTVGNSPWMPENLNADFLCVKSLDRPDYNRFWGQIIDQVHSEKEVIDILFRKNRREAVYGIFLLVRFFPFFVSIFSRKPCQSFYCYLKRVQYEKVLRKVAKYSYHTLIVFGDMQPIERALVFQARDKGKTTVTLQHGLYVDYTGLDTVNKVNYENVCSDYFLAWGNETRELIAGYAPLTTVVVCGKPFLSPGMKESKGYFSIIFDQKLYTRYNKELLSIAILLSKRLSLKINLRVHPWDSVDNYELNGLGILLNEPLENSEFSIGHTSTFIFELMRMGMPVYRYKTEIPANRVNAPIEFSDIDSLMALMENSRRLNWRAAGKHYIEFVGNESLLRYERVFMKLAENSRHVYDQEN